MTTKDERVHQRRPVGSGGISVIGPGKYRLTVYPPDGSPRLTARYTGTEGGARKRLKELIAQANSGTPAGDTSQLGGFIDKWLRDEDTKVANGKKDWKTVVNYRWALSHVGDKYRRKSLRQLTTDDVEDILTEVAAIVDKNGKRMARSCVGRVKSVLSMVLDRALAKRMVPYNVAKVANLPETPDPEEGRSLSEAELERLWRASEPYPLYHAFLVAGWQLGLRLGELLGLGWAELDFEHHIATVTYRLDRGDGKTRKLRRVRGAKAGSERQVVMPEETEAALMRWGAKQLELASECGDAWGNEEEQAVFTTTLGTLINPSNLDDDLAPLFQAAGLEGRYSFTDLGRRSSATYLRDKGLDLDDIAEQFGHKDTRMLQKHYVKLRRPNDKHLAVWEARRERLGQ
jgi:integrase